MIVKRARPRLETNSQNTYSDSERKQPLRMIAGSFYIPKKNDLKPLGEDGHFVCPERDTIGVADGVGSWSKYGIDSGEYARLLMENSLNAIIETPKKNDVDPKRVLYRAYLKTQVDGSSTACIITLNNRTLCAANVGDSGFMVFREKELVYQSRFQQHRFNNPYQLGLDDFSDDPSAADEMEIAVEAGDLVVAGTDGLFDNIRPSEIEEILSEVAQGCLWPEQLARCIAETALFNSEDKNYTSPFEDAAYFAGRRHTGGKIDDITVIVGLIESCKV